MDPNCWEWNGYIGECIRWHKEPWWDYLNVWSICAVLGFSATIFLVYLLILKRWG